jgi:hypothetical protein
MHPSIVMSSRAHLWLRLSALALLASAAVWPRSDRLGGTPHELVRTRTPQVETVAARRDPHAPRMKLVVADADESRLTN